MNILTTLREIIRKELLVQIKSRRLPVIAVLFLVSVIALIYYGNYITGSGDDPIYHNGIPEAMSVIMGFTSIFPVILAIALSYDSIVSERVNRSFHLMVTRPIKREAVFLGKYLAAMIIITVVYLTVATIAVLIMGALGGMPSMDDTVRIYASVGVILLGTSVWVAFTMLFSTLLKTQGTVLVVVIISWILIIPLVSQVGLIYHLVTAKPTSQEPTNIYITASPSSMNTTNVMFTAMDMDSEPQHNIYYVVTDSQGNKMSPEPLISPTTGGMMYVLQSGRYSWSAYYLYETEGGYTYNPDEKVSWGEFNLLPGVGFTYIVTPLGSSGGSGGGLSGDDINYDDIYITVYPGDANFTAEVLRGSEVVSNGTFQHSRGGSSIVLYDIDEGQYKLRLKYRNETILEAQVHSYGVNGIMKLLDPDNIPDYVKYNLMLDPSTDTSVYRNILMNTSGGYLDWQEGVTALVVLTVAYIGTGIALFRRIELF